MTCKERLKNVACQNMRAKTHGGMAWDLNESSHDPKLAFAEVGVGDFVHTQSWRLRLSTWPRPRPRTRPHTLLHLTPHRPSHRLTPLHTPKRRQTLRTHLNILDVVEETCAECDAEVVWVHARNGERAGECVSLD